MKKAKTVITLTATFFVAALSAQDQPQQPQPPALKPLPAKVAEYGIGLSNLNSFSLQYRWGNETRLYRVQGNIGGGAALQPSVSSNNTGTSYSPFNLNCGLSFSILKIKNITEKFGIVYGDYLGIGYLEKITNYTGLNVGNGLGSATKTNSQGFSGSVGFVLGAVYKINSSFLIYAEIDPGISYSYNNTHTVYLKGSSDNSFIITNTFGLNGLSNSGAMLTLVYRITK